MLKKLVNCSYIRKTKKIFRQIISFVAWSDPGKFYRTYTAYIYFSPLCPSRGKKIIFPCLTIYGFSYFTDRQCNRIFSYFNAFSSS